MLETTAALPRLAAQRATIFSRPPVSLVLDTAAGRPSTISLAHAKALTRVGRIPLARTKASRIIIFLRADCGVDGQKTMAERGVIAVIDRVHLFPLQYLFSHHGDAFKTNTTNNIQARMAWFSQ